MIDRPDLLVFGGTFDPPHRGHLLCLEAALTAFPGQGLVIPAYTPPVSATAVKSTKTSFQHRLTMTRLLFADSKWNHDISVLDIESRLPSPSYSWQTLSRLKSEYSGKVLALVIGFDQLSKIHKWYKANELLDLVSLVVINRGAADLAQAVRDLSGHLNRPYSESSGEYRWCEKATGIFLIPEDVSPLSSTELRQSSSIVAGVTTKVAEYIKQNHLYHNEEKNV